MSQQPNILVICSDQHTPGVTGCYGDRVVQTPNLDRLAAEGTCYDSAYCNQPLCVPSRMSFLTGRYPSRIGVLGNGHVLDSRIPTFAHVAAASEYRTVLAGRMHFVGPDQYHGFQERIASDYTAYAFHCAKINRYNPLNGLLGSGGRPDALLEVGEGVTCTQRMDKETTAAAIDWLRGCCSEGTERPFLMTVGYFSPHCPYIAESPYFRRYEGRVQPHSVTDDELASLHPCHMKHREQIRIATIPGENIEKATAAYYGLVDFLDDQVDMLLETLEDLGLTENTVIIYTSDHGEMLGEHGRWHKQSFFEASARVPLIIRPAGGDAARRVPVPVSLVDLFPTIAALIGTEIPFHVDGRELLQSRPDGRPVFAEFHDGNGSHRMIRTERYKLNYYAGYESYELFDLEKDPGELTNVSGDAAYAEIESELRQQLFADGWSGSCRLDHDRYLEELGYPLVRAMGKPTQALIENGTIVEVPGYDVAAGRYPNRLETE